MAEAKENSTMMIVVVIAVVAGLYLFMKNKSGGGGLGGPAGPGGMGSLDEMIRAQRQGFVPRPGDQYEPVDPTEATPNLGTVSAWPNEDKMGVPIISGSVDSMDPKEFDVSAAGTCQCSSTECCYYAPFYSKYGEKRGYGAPRKCTRVFWGDQVTACEKVVDEFQRENERFNSARAAISYLAYHPSAAYQAARLQRARYARALS
jgi:hypothetical protein